MNTSTLWFHHTAHIANQYRALADWIEETSIMTWHVSFDWNSNRLVVHIHDNCFFATFAAADLQCSEDMLGVTSQCIHNGLQFTCFVPHLSQKESA